MADAMTRPQLRELLQDTLRVGTEFDAFVLDYFPTVYERYVGGMDRLSRTSLLFESVDTEDILRALSSSHPRIAARLSAFPAPAPAQPRAVSVLATSSKYILHLSDLHFTESSQAPQWHTQILLDLKNQMQIKELAGVVISGDITHHASAEQYGHAQRFLEMLRKTFKVAPQQLVIVPGNHDVNWNLTDHGGDGMAPFASFYQAACGGSYPLDSAEQATLHHFPDLNLLTLGLNSAWKTDRANSKRAGLHPSAFGHALGQIVETEDYQKCIKLAVWHHPASELLPDGGLDGAVLQQLAQAGFRLVLHGHVHHADNLNFRYYRSSPFGNVEILTAGTFGAPTRELLPRYPFQYQVLEFAGDTLTVHTRKREDVAGGWVPDHRWPQSPGQSPLASYLIKLRA